MKQTIHLTESELKKVINNLIQEMNYKYPDMKYRQIPPDQYTNPRFNDEARFVDCGEDFGTWRIKGPYAAPTDNAHIWCFGSISFPENYIDAPDEEIIKFIKKWCTKSLQDAYRRQ